MRILLFLMLAILGVFTFNAWNAEGFMVIETALKNIQGGGWNAQFNFDFLCYLILSGIWIAWRHQFRWKGLLLGILAMVGGMLFFAPYLWWEIQQGRWNSSTKP